MSHGPLMVERRRTRLIVPRWALSDRGAFEVVRRAAGVFDRNAHRYSMVAIKDLPDMDSYALPVNFPLSILEEATGLKPRVKIVQTSSPDLPALIPWNDEFGPKDDLQIKVGRFLYATHMQGAPSKMVCTDTGTGKTFMAVRYTSENSLRPFIIAERTDVLDQWETAFRKFTRIGDDAISRFDDTAKVLKMIDGGKVPAGPVYMSTYRFLQKLEEKMYGGVRELFSILKVGLKIFDEANVEMDALWAVESTTDVRETLYLTATPKRTDWKEKKVLQMMLPMNVAFFDYASGNPDRRFMYVATATFDSRPAAEDLEDVQGENARHGFDVLKYCSLLMLDDRWRRFSGKIVSLIRFLMTPKGSAEPALKRTAVVLKKIEMVERFAADLAEAFPSAKIVQYVGDKSGMYDDVRSADFIVTTDKSFNNAIDIPGLRFVVNSIPFSSDVIAEQVSGRLRRIDGKKVVYVDIADSGFSGTMRQRKRRMAVFNRKAKSFVDLDQLMAGKASP